MLKVMVINSRFGLNAKKSMVLPISRQEERTGNFFQFVNLIAVFLLSHVRVQFHMRAIAAATPSLSFVSVW